MINKDELSELILELGSATPKEFTWSNELREKFDNIFNETKKKYVFVNGYGLLPFKVRKVETNFGNPQYKGVVRLPKGVFTSTGKKWNLLDYWYNEQDIFDDIESAIRSIIKNNP